MDITLRPTLMSEVVGQSETVKRLNVVIKSSRVRKSLPGHILFSGPPGLGKTSLSHVVAKELGVPIVALQGPMLDSPSAVLTSLAGIRKDTVVFIDEIHAVNPDAEEVLYSALEDGKLPMSIDDKKGLLAGQWLDLAPITFIGATTKVGELSRPMRDRFSYDERLHLYTTDELTSIVVVNAERLGLDITEEGAAIIASRSRGTPRVANNLLLKSGDWLASQDEATVGDSAHIREALDFWGIDPLGIDNSARQVLDIIVNIFNGGPVGLTKIAAQMGESASMIEANYEPSLVASGLVKLTPQGRVATDAGIKHLA